MEGGVPQGGAHKTKQEMTKHLDLLASLGRLGLSEHMLQVDLEGQEPTRGVRLRRQSGVQTNSERWRGAAENPNTCASSHANQQDSES